MYRDFSHFFNFSKWIPQVASRHIRQSREAAVRSLNWLPAPHPGERSGQSHSPLVHTLKPTPSQTTSSNLLFFLAQEYVVMNLDSRLLSFPLYVGCNFLYTSPHSDQHPDSSEQESATQSASWCLHLNCCSWVSSYAGSYRQTKRQQRWTYCVHAVWDPTEKYFCVMCFQEFVRKLFETRTLNFDLCFTKLQCCAVAARWGGGSSLVPDNSYLLCLEC